MQEAGDFEKSGAVVQGDVLINLRKMANSFKATADAVAVSAILNEYGG